MKKIKLLFLFLPVVLFSLFMITCSKDNPDEELCTFTEITNKTDGSNTGAISFYNQYKSTTDAVLIDFRSAAEFKKGHIEGAENLPATVYNTQESYSQWCTDLEKKYSGSGKALFLYGTTDMALIKVTAGRGACIFPKGKTFILSTGYEGLSIALPDLIVSE